MLPPLYSGICSQKRLPPSWLYPPTALFENEQPTNPTRPAVSEKVGVGGILVAVGWLVMVGRAVGVVARVAVGDAVGALVGHAVAVGTLVGWGGDVGVIGDEQAENTRLTNEMTISDCFISIILSFHYRTLFDPL